MRNGVLLPVALGVLLLLSACGAEKAVADIKVALEENCKAVRAEPLASPEHGKISFQVTNRGATEVDFAIHKGGRDVAELKGLKAGQTGNKVVTLEDGIYELTCEVGGKVVGRAPFEVK